MTLDDFHALWLQRDYPDLSEKGKESYDTIWPKFEAVKGMKMREINTETIQPLVDLKIEKGRSRSQQEKIRSMYSLLCQLAMEKNVIDRNYANFLKLSKQKEIRRDVFTKAEIEAVLKDAAACETSKIIAIFLYTGFRIQELLLGMPPAATRATRRPATSADGIITPRWSGWAYGPPSGP